LVKVVGFAKENKLQSLQRVVLSPTSESLKITFVLNLFIEKLSLKKAFSEKKCLALSKEVPPFRKCFQDKYFFLLGHKKVIVHSD
jgi:hypothetical protein